ncbi:MAG: S1 family peptidase [Gemmatimonadaceae bacterium]
MNWNEVVEKVTPYVVKIETPEGHGTGFLCLFNETRVWCGIATAHHVIEHAERWGEPIRINHFPSGTSALIKEGDRIVFPDAKTDSAVVLIPVGTLKLPEDLIPLRPTEHRLPIGVEVAWLGYPGMSSISDTLCFFSGNVSAWQVGRAAYLIDGVTVHGSSGGPVLYSSTADGVQIIGAVSAYMINRATGEALPGLSVAQDVSHFNDITRHVKSVDEAYKQKQELEPILFT